MKRKIITCLVMATLLFVTTPFALATDYDVELVVPDGKKSKETDAVLTVSDTSVLVAPEKGKFVANGKTFAIADIKTADYSYSKKPMLSAGGAVASAIVLGLFVVPFLFIKKRSHWLTIQTEKDFAVVKMDNSNYKAILAEFNTHGVKVSESKEEDKSKK